MIPDRLVISMISPNSIPKIFVIARTDTTHEKISKALYTEPFQLVHLSDEQKYFDVVDELETACVLVAVSDNPEEELDVIASLQARNPARHVIAISDQWTVSDAVKAIKLGADDVCDLQGQVSQLRKMIYKALTSESPKPKGIHDVIPAAILELLETNEAKIMHLIALGLTAKEIGVALDVSIRTYHYRKKSIFQKLGVANRSEMIELIRTSSGRTLEWHHQHHQTPPPKILRTSQLKTERDYANYDAVTDGD
jgi:DNA-binding NarL/FixJ family response regulator